MKRALVTGGSRGIGSVVATQLADEGWAVTICARGQSGIDEVLAALPGEGHDGLALDVGDPAAWNSAASRLQGVTALVCAAGVIGPIGPLQDIEANGFLETLRVNVLGTMLAIQACEESLRANDGTAVILSGGGATGPFARFDAYAASKAAVVRLAENLSKNGLRVNAVAPGFIVTAMQDDVLAAGREAVGSEYFKRVESAVAGGGGDDPRRAAQLISFLLSDAAAGITGKLLGAPWDPWDQPDFVKRLASEPDLATLRRIDDQFFAALDRA